MAQPLLSKHGIWTARPTGRNLGRGSFLASDRASYISGAMITIDGGIVARAGAPGDLIGDTL